MQWKCPWANQSHRMMMMVCSVAVEEGGKGGGKVRWILLRYWKEKVFFFLLSRVAALSIKRNSAFLFFLVGLWTLLEGETFLQKMKQVGEERGGAQIAQGLSRHSARRFFVTYEKASEAFVRQLRIFYSSFVLLALMKVPWKQDFHFFLHLQRTQSGEMEVCASTFLHSHSSPLLSSHLAKRVQEREQKVFSTKEKEKLWHGFLSAECHVREFVFKGDMAAY